MQFDPHNPAHFFRCPALLSVCPEERSTQETRPSEVVLGIKGRVFVKALYRLGGGTGLVVIWHYKHTVSACIPPGTGSSLLYVATYSRGAQLCPLPLASPAMLLIPRALPPLRLLCPGGQILPIVSPAFTAHAPVILGGGAPCQDYRNELPGGQGPRRLTMPK